MRQQNSNVNTSGPSAPNLHCNISVEEGPDRAMGQTMDRYFCTAILALKSPLSRKETGAQRVGKGFGSGQVRALPCPAPDFLLLCVLRSECGSCLFACPFLPRRAPGLLRLLLVDRERASLRAKLQCSKLVLLVGRRMIDPTLRPRA
jgi:hypothetical protein